MDQPLSALRMASYGAALEFSAAMADFSRLATDRDNTNDDELRQTAERCFVIADAYQLALEKLRDGISGAMQGYAREGELQRTEKMMELLAVEREAISRLLGSITSKGRMHRTKSAAAGPEEGAAKREFETSEKARRLAEHERDLAERGEWLPRQSEN